MAKRFSVRDRPTTDLTPAPRTWKVLVVEDNPDHVWMLQRTLTGSGRFDVVTARSAREARAAVAEAPPEGFDAVVTDQRLPDTEGLRFIEELRKGGYAGIVLLVTAHATDDVAEKGLEAGADDYVFKARGYPDRVVAELVDRLEDEA